MMESRLRQVITVLQATKMKGLRVSISKANRERVENG
jgi:hypothetical protein